MALSTSPIRRLLHEPLLHFLFAGGVLFVCSQFSGSGGMAPPKHIEVGAAQLDRLARNFQSFAGRNPDADEMQEMVDDYVLDEMLYREALARGLDKNDTIIRDRLRQKLEFICEEAAVVAEPADAELESYLRDHADYFSVGPQITFKQVFFSRVDRPASAEADAKALLEAWADQGSGVDVAHAGDSAPFPNAFQQASYNRVKALFGDLFLEKLERAEIGLWTGPIESEFGLHVVYVSERTPERLPALKDVREQVRLEWLAERKLRARDEAVEAIRSGYSVSVAPYTPAPAGEGGVK